MLSTRGTFCSSLIFTFERKGSSKQSELSSFSSCLFDVEFSQLLIRSRKESKNGILTCKIFFRMFTVLYQSCKTMFVLFFYFCLSTYSTHLSFVHNILW